MRRRNRTPAIKYPTNNQMLVRARQFAEVAHQGKMYQGMPYVQHAIRVSDRVLPIGPGYAIVGLLHDVIEDTGAGISVIQNAFNPTITDAVDAISRRSNETYADYIKRVKLNNIARIVKIADIEENLLWGVVEGAPMNAALLRTRYLNALQELLS